MMKSQVSPELLNQLRRAGLVAALPDVRSLRLRRYLSQPKQLLRDGWRLSEDCSTDSDAPRRYVLGHPGQVGQQLQLDRQANVLILRTEFRSNAQEIAFDFASGEVLSNRVA